MTYGRHPSATQCCRRRTIASLLYHRDTDAVLLDICQHDDELTVSAMDLHRDGKRCQIDPEGQLVISTAIMSDVSQCCTGRVLTAPLDRIDIMSMITPSPSTPPLRLPR